MKGPPTTGQMAVEQLRGLLGIMARRPLDGANSHDLDNMNAEVKSLARKIETLHEAALDREEMARPDVRRWSIGSLDIHTVSTWTT